MIIYYSGDGAPWSQPEIVLEDRCTLMLTYWDFHKAGKPDSRFKRVLRKRKENRKQKAKQR